MPTQDEKNLALNRFMGWIEADGEDQLDNFYADTPEARERTRLLKDEFVRRTGMAIDIHMLCVWTEPRNIDFTVAVAGYLSTHGPVESHAILDAIYEAIRS